MDAFHDLRQIRRRLQRNLIIGHLNINSVVNKFEEIQDMLVEGLTDCMALSETKLDGSFPNAQFQASGYRLFRADRDRNGGGLMMYVRDDLPARQLQELDPSSSHLESLIIEISLDKEKWILPLVYKPPSMNNRVFCNHLATLLDRCLLRTPNILLLGDLNQDMLKPDTYGCELVDLCDVFDMHCLINEPTCFKGTPSLLDVFLTTRPDMFTKAGTIESGLSDFHKYTYTVKKGPVPPRKPDFIEYRSYKNFKEDNYVKDLSAAPFSVCEIFDDVNDCLWAFTYLQAEIMDDHTPYVRKKLRKSQVPYMSAAYRKATYKKAQLKNRHQRFPTRANWEAYRRQRNLCTNMRRNSVKQYFRERCGGGAKNKDFHKTITPFLTKKNTDRSSIILLEDNRILNDNKAVAEKLNHYFTTVAEDIGNAASSTDAVHGVHQIDPCMTFKEVSHEDVLGKLKGLNTKKATGVDRMPPKLLKIGADSVTPSVRFLINKSLTTCTFPDVLKQAVVTPVYKKKDALDKANYRPVSILPTLSKVFEGVLTEQLDNHLKDIFSPHLCAFRRGYSCQAVLLRMVEDWRKSLDEKKTVGAILMDLSKAFDCLPHDILVAKLKAYGLHDSAAEIITSYLENRRQCVKVQTVLSDWLPITKGVPQGSLLGPLLFNTFINDFISCMPVHVYNYADDNTLSASDTKPERLIRTLEGAALDATQWFERNGMLANPSKFQAIVLHPKRTSNTDPVNFKFVNSVIQSSQSVSVLGVTIDDQLNFTTHINVICRKAAQQLNVLKRLSSLLDFESRMLIFKSFILSNFNYCPLVWHFCGCTNMKKLERIQYRALKFVFGSDDSYEILLDRANLPSLNLGRIRKIAIETYKIINHYSPSMLHDMIVTRDNNRAFIPRRNTTRFGLNSFMYNGAKI
jgi:hypothetical protein